jgi:short-subunit dehydrogenase
MLKKWLYPLGIVAGGVLGASLGQRLLALSQIPHFDVTHPRPGTALITGASSGIGTAFAHELAQRGYKLILVARREAKLNDLAQELETKFATQVQVIVADLADSATLDSLAEKIQQWDDLTLLINNAGFGTTEHFAQVDLASQLAMLRVHVEASVRFTHAALPNFIARQRGAIINLSSIAAFLPSPGNPSYSGTKSYLVMFSEALQSELYNTGVRVQALCPGFTHTEFHTRPAYAKFDKRSIYDFLWMTPPAVVRESLAGLTWGPVTLIPGWQNKFLIAVARHWLTQPFFFALLKRRWGEAVGE